MVLAGEVWREQRVPATLKGGEDVPPTYYGISFSEAGFKESLTHHLWSHLNTQPGVRGRDPTLLSSVDRVWTECCHRMQQGAFSSF